MLLLRLLPPSALAPPRMGISPDAATCLLLTASIRRPAPDKRLLRAKQNLKKQSQSLSLTTTPSSPPNSGPEYVNLTPSHAVGLVAAAQANYMRVIVESACDEVAVGADLLCVVRAVLKKIRRRVLVGDRVLVASVDWVDRRGMIEEVFERKSEVVDPPVANVDRLIVMFAVNKPRPEPFGLTRFLVEAESTGIPVSLVFNKADLADEKTLSSWRDRLRSWGYEPLFCSVDQKSGLASLEEILKGNTSVVVGPSGVGKSSLINCLRGNQNTFEDDSIFKLIEQNGKWFGEQRVGSVSKRSGKGTHTTRHVSLLPLFSGGFIADTPGFNQPSLMKVTKRNLAQTFPEIQKMLKDSEPLECSFNDCLHLGEPGCVVNANWERFPHYLQLLDEIKIREELQLRTIGTKREGDVRYKMGNMGVKQAEPRLELKKHRRVSRKRINQEILDDLDDLDDLENA